MSAIAAARRSWSQFHQARDSRRRPISGASLPSVPVPYRASFLKRHVRALLASVALAIGLAWIMHRGALPLLPPKGTLERVEWLRVALLVVALFVSITGRFARWAFLLAPLAKVPFKRLMGISCIAVGLITFLPFRLGEVARPAMLREKGKLSGWAVTGTVGAERIIDGVLFSIMLLLGLAFAAPHEPLPERIGNLPVPAAYVPRAALARLPSGKYDMAAIRNEAGERPIGDEAASVPAAPPVGQPAPTHPPSIAADHRSLPRPRAGLHFAGET